MLPAQRRLDALWRESVITKFRELIPGVEGTAEYSLPNLCTHPWELPTRGLRNDPRDPRSVNLLWKSGVKIQISMDAESLGITKDYALPRENKSGVPGGELRVARQLLKDLRVRRQQSLG